MSFLFKGRSPSNILTSQTYKYILDRITCQKMIWKLLCVTLLKKIIMNKERVYHFKSISNYVSYKFYLTFLYGTLMRPVQPILVHLIYSVNISDFLEREIGVKRGANSFIISHSQRNVGRFLIK